MQEAEYIQRIAAAGGHVDVLRQLADELKDLPDSWAKLLRWKVVALVVKARTPRRDQGSSSPDASPVVVSDWLARYGLPNPDGRPLYRYRLGTDTYLSIEDYLKQRAPVLRFHTSSSDAALFVLWAAEWFRRCYDGKGQEWRRLGEPIGLSREQAGWRKLADTGLKQWRVPELRISGVHHRLAAIARQGGFPLAAIEGQGSGWAPKYLERLVGVLLNEAELTLENATRVAAELSGLVPETWRNEEMHVVCAELALEVVRLRHLAEAAGVSAGSLVSAWLDHNHPGWREDLPLSVDSAAGRALVDGLMKAVPLKGGAGSVRAKRLLTIGTNRVERVGINLEGSLNDANGKAIAKSVAGEWSRLRIFPAGEFAHHVAGELGTADPDEGGTWTARPSTSRAEFDLPFGVPVVAELRGDGQRVGQPFILPGGDRISGGLRVCVSLSEEGDAAPTQFEVVGSGSGGYRAECVYLDLPDAWSAVARDEQSDCSRSPGAQLNGRTMWRLRGSVVVTSERGDCYLVRTGQKGDQRDALSLVGDAPSNCFNLESSTRIFSGAPRLELQEGRRKRSPGPNEAWWRARGEREWRPYAGNRVLGPCEFAWRDAQTGHIRDRADAVVLPQDFRVEQNRIGDWVDISVRGWPGLVQFEGGRSAANGAWRYPTKGTSRSRCEARLAVAGQDDIRLAIPIPHQALIEHWTNGPIAPNAVISLSTINQFVARTQGRCELMADLLDREGRPVAQGLAHWWVEEELSLSTIRDDVANLLRPLGDIRARIKLNFNDSYDNFWYLSEFDHELRKEGRGYLPDRALLDEDISIVGRSLQNPSAERADFGTYGLLDCVNHRPFELPTLHGNWLVYLRSNDRVLSCPYFIRGRELAVPPSTPLAKAMGILERGERLDALRELCDDLFREPTSNQSRDTIKMVIALALSLDGLPPSTFDIFSLICERPLLGTMMLFAAQRVEVEAILRLSRGLPFDWCLVGKENWDAAAQAQAEFLFKSLPDELALVAKAIGDRRKEIVEQEPVLCNHVGLTSSSDAIDAIANSFLTRSGDRIAVNMPNPFRPSLESDLPRWKVGEHFWRALDAPVAAARAAFGSVQLDGGQIYCVKDISRRHPRWFREAFSAAYQESKARG